MRYAFPIANAGFDPARILDLYSRTLTAHIFEALYTYDHLARPPRMIPLTAAGMPEASSDFRTWTFRVTPGIYFADDPAFAGRRRELVAADYLYIFRRIADPANLSQLWSQVAEWQILGLAELRAHTRKARTAFDYDAPVEGLRELDRYTLQIRLGKTLPRFGEQLAASDLLGAVAREVVEHYGEAIGDHPVGTGPFKLAEWRRSSRVVLVRNPDYRVRLWQADPAPDDAEGQAIAARLRGRRVPMLDRVEVSIITEEQPRWLSFLGGESDLVYGVPAQFIDQAMPGGRVAPNLARQGITGVRALAADIALTYFNMQDPLVGGLDPAHVALRRAICLARDTDREIRLVRHGMAIPAQSPIQPYLSGYDPAFKSEMSEYSPARAKALLDLYGWVDRNGDGWRERPDGSPLVLEYATTPDQVNRQLNEMWQRDMNAIGLKIVFKTAQWQEDLKAAFAGKLMMWGLGYSAASGDGQDALTLYYGPQAGQGNLARFEWPVFDKLYDRLQVLPDGPERNALFDEAKRIAVAYAPYQLSCHRILADMMVSGLVGFRRPLWWGEWWHMVDVEPPRRAVA
ncbi:MAG: bicyclomycin resistance protein [Burkholderiales bacterium]|nr:bicyclomycin resistance protein [Burkholderiales bacterium]